LRAEDRVLVNAAASVADGAPVDWTEAESHADFDSRRLVRHLRLVESIASLHRSIPHDIEDDVPPRIAADPGGPRWGRLVLLGRIGGGSSCDVFRAWDSALHRDVALKLLHDDDGSRESQARLIDEARRLARLRHEHVVQVYGAEQHDNRVGLWMELVRGQSLEALVKTRGPLGAREAALIGLDLCAALASVHAAGLVHRDVKAQNVMREDGGRVVLMDFGTGEERGSRSRLAGTPLYLAPEIFRGQRASVQSDLYSLGVLVYFLVTGTFPVLADSVERLARAHDSRARRPLRDLRPDAPENFVRAVERALDSDPSRRYRSAGEMETALREAIEGRAPAPETEVQRPPARNWRWIEFAAAAAVLVLAVVATTLLLSNRTPATVPPANPASTTIASVAVLPLTDQSEAPSPHLAEALTDQLIVTVGQIGSLRVTSRSSVMPFKGVVQSAREIARTLGVDALLESSMVRVKGTGGLPDRIRVNARLVLAGTDALIWSRSFEHQLGDMLALQAEIARAVADGVKAVVTPSESTRLRQIRQTSPAAEEAFLAGRYHLGRYGLASAEQALQAFTEATEIDPSYAAAFAGAARARFALGFGGRISHAEARAKALADVERALHLDANQPDAHAAMGDIRFYYDWDWKGAEAEYRQSIQLNPSFTYARSQFARFLAAARRGEEAAAEIGLATELDPLSVEAAQTRGLISYYRRDYQTAARELEQALRLDGRNARTHVVFGRIYEAEGRMADALAETTRAVDLADEPGASLRVQAIRQLALTGRPRDARAQFAELERELVRRNIRIEPEQLAYFYLALGEHERALDWLERAVADRQPVLWLAVDPRVDPIRSSPRFESLLVKLGLQ
jgi:eukaryotic-like serine/threonine-protein kinase